jgi:hypothetical protein
MLGAGCVPPSYIRSIVLRNLSPSSLKIKTIHSSGDIHSHSLDPTQTKKIEITLSHDTFQTVDPIKSFRVSIGENEDGKEMLMVAQGVEIRCYVLEEEKGELMIRQVERKEFH